MTRVKFYVMHSDLAWLAKVQKRFVDGESPANRAKIIQGAVSVGLGSLVLVPQTLRRYRRRSRHYHGLETELSPWNAHLLVLLSCEVRAACGALVTAAFRCGLEHLERDPFMLEWWAEDEPELSGISVAEEPEGWVLAQ